MSRRMLMLCLGLVGGAVHGSDMAAVRAAENAVVRAVGGGEARVGLPVATPVEIRIAQPLDSRTAHAGDRFKLTTTRDVYIGDELAIPAGSEGEGEVLDASPAGFGGKPGELVLAAKFVRVGDRIVPLRSLKLAAKGKGRYDQAVAASMVYWAAGLFVSGGDIVLPADSIGEAAIADDLDLPAASNVGTVVFFRSPKFAGSGVRYKVREGEVALGKLKRATFFTTTLPAGRHVFRVHTEAEDRLTLDVAPGETYFVRGEVTQGFLLDHPNLTLSDQQTFEMMKPKLEDVTGKYLRTAKD